jgi:hypothetical protein
MSYHCRNRVPVEDIRRGRKSASRQEDVILKFFETHADQEYTPFEVLSQTGLNCPITSIRRAITDLTSAHKLEKEDRYGAPGIYGVLNCVWRLRRVVAQPELFQEGVCTN